jgi:hypothetical protein
MDGFDQILNWKLKFGSHRFPGKDGGTCINEAAIVAAGFEYRPVNRVEDMPACFSRPICRLALWLNDNATDDDRQLLLPYVARLACADTPEIESRRKYYINSRVTGWITTREGIEILEGALAIGRQAEKLASEVTNTRLDGAKEKASQPEPQSGMCSKVKVWFASQKVAA